MNGLAGNGGEKVGPSALPNVNAINACGETRRETVGVVAWTIPYSGSIHRDSSAPFAAPAVGPASGAAMSGPATLPHSHSRTTSTGDMPRRSSSQHEPRHSSRRSRRASFLAAYCIPMERRPAPSDAPSLRSPSRRSAGRAACASLSAFRGHLCATASHPTGGKIACLSRAPTCPWLISYPYHHACERGVAWRGVGDFYPLVISQPIKAVENRGHLPPQPLGAISRM